MHHLESRRWFQYAVGITAVVLVLALAIPIYIGLPSDAAARIALPFLAAGAVSGFARLLTMVLPLVLLKVWPRLEREAL